MMPADTQEHIPEDDSVEFPELDDGSGDEPEDDFGAHETAFEESGDVDDDADGLEVGMEEAVELELDTGEETADWSAGADEASDLLDHDLDLSEPADGSGEDFSDDSEGLPDAAHDAGFLGDPEEAPISDDGDEGLEVELMDVLPALPRLQDDDVEVEPDDDMGDESWSDDIALPPSLDYEQPAAARGLNPGSSPPRRSTLQVGAYITVAPGIRWRKLPDVEQTRIARPGGRSEFGLHTLGGGSAFVYLGQLYRVSYTRLQPLRAMGLRPNLLALCASPVDRNVLWAVTEQGAQLSQDGGISFSPPIRLPRRRGTANSIRGAATSDGTLWFTQDGELYRLGLRDLGARAIACEEPPVEIAGDGHVGLLVVGATGRVFVSENGGRTFQVWPGPESLPQSVQLCGGRGLLMAAGGWVLVDEVGYRHLFTGSAQLGTLARSAEGYLDVYAFVHTEQAWHLVRMPTDNRSSRPSVVISSLPSDVGAPRFLLVYPERDSTTILVGADHAFLHLEVPNENDD